MGWEIMTTENSVLKSQREKLGLTQEEVAQRAGIRLEQYQRYEKNDIRISSSSLRIVHAVLKALELDTTDFTKGKYATRSITEDDPLYKFIKEFEKMEGEHE